MLLNKFTVKSAFLLFVTCTVLATNNLVVINNTCTAKSIWSIVILKLDAQVCQNHSPGRGR